MIEMVQSDSPSNLSAWFWYYFTVTFLENCNRIIYNYDCGNVSCIIPLWNYLWFIFIDFAQQMDLVIRYCFAQYKKIKICTIYVGNNSPKWWMMSLFRWWYLYKAKSFLKTIMNNIHINCSCSKKMQKL